MTKVALVCLTMSHCLLVDKIKPIPGGTSATTGAALGDACTRASSCGAGTCLAGHCATAVPTACATAVPDSTGPVLFFSDLESGPASGGENGLGVFITLYGLRFGAARGASTVSINGIEVASYTSWNAPEAQPSTHDNRVNARGIERIVIQPGAQVTSGSIVVVVDDKASNPLPFTVRAGQIFFIDGSVSGSGDGSTSAPFAHIYDAKAHAHAGDTIYIKSGGAGFVYGSDPDSAGQSAGSDLLLTASNASAGAAGAPIAYVGYPNDMPTLGADVSYARGVVFASPALDDYTIANLHFDNLGGAILGSDSEDIGVRVIGNKFTTTTGTFVGAINLANQSSGWTIAGNYFDADNDAYACITFFDSVQDIDIGWNEFYDTYVISTAGEADGLRFHDNQIVKLNRGIDLNFSGTFARASLANNVIIRTTLNLGGIVANASDFVIVHNDFDQGESISSTAAGSASAIFLADNIFSSDGDHYVASQPDFSDFATPTHNLYDSSASGPLPFAGEPGVQTANPLYASRALVDYSLTAHSPAIDAGVDAGVCGDFLGVQRPQGAAVDIGAFEFAN